MGVRRETGKEQEVKVHYDEDLASHIAPEPCVSIRIALVHMAGPGVTG
jgi:hypothetical protein